MLKFKKFGAAITRPLVWVIVTGMTWSAAAIAPAADFPDHPVRVIVPYLAGGGTDTVARAIAARLTERWGKNVFVENRGGAGTAIGLFVQWIAGVPFDPFELDVAHGRFGIKFVP